MTISPLGTVQFIETAFNLLRWIHESIFFHQSWPYETGRHPIEMWRKKNISRSVAQKKYLCFTPATTRNTIWIITIIKWKIFLLHHRLIIIIITILFFCRRFEMGKRARTSNMIAHTQYLCIFSAGVYPVPLYKSFQFPIPFYRIHIHLQNWPLATISESLFFLLLLRSIHSKLILFSTVPVYANRWTFWRRKKRSGRSNERSHRWKLIMNICIEWMKRIQN